MLLIRVDDEVGIPLDTDDPAHYPARYIGAIGTGGFTGAFGDDSVAVDDVNGGQNVLFEVREDLLILGVDVAQTLDIVLVDPYALKEIDRFIGVFIKIVERQIELRAHGGIDTDAVAVHLADVFEPSQIGLIADREIAGEQSGLRRADIDAGHELLFPAAVLIHAEILTLRLEAVAQVVGGIHVFFARGVYVGAFPVLTAEDRELLDTERREQAGLRQKKEHDNDKQQAYEVLHFVLKTFATATAPILPFLCEEIWSKIGKFESI